LLPCNRNARLYLRIQQHSIIFHYFLPASEATTVRPHLC